PISSAITMAGTGTSRPTSGAVATAAPATSADSARPGRMPRIDALARTASGAGADSAVTWIPWHRQVWVLGRYCRFRRAGWKDRLPDLEGGKGIFQTCVAGEKEMLRREG